jgi:predicted nucleic acid-binding protein
MSSLIVVLDANVLFPASLRDTLLRAAKANLYQFRCTEDILEEVQRNLVNKRKINEKQAQRLMNTIRFQFTEAIITHHKVLVSSMTNEQGDRHVLAAAVAVKAQIIVTKNLQDFPLSVLAPFEIQPQSPDTFLTQLYRLYPQVMSEIIVHQASDLQKPARTTRELLGNLSLHAPNFASLVLMELD